MLKSKFTVKMLASVLILALLPCTGCKKTPQGNPITYSELKEPKSYSTATVEDNFIDNKIMVIMQPYASSKNYTAQDFPEIKCKKATTLTDDYYIQQGANKAIILTLKKRSKQNVINAIKLLEQREDVLVAEPAYEGTFSKSSIPKENQNSDDALEYKEKKYYVFDPESFYISDYKVDSRIHIFMQPYAQNNEYTVEDFAYVGCTNIEKPEYSKNYFTLVIPEAGSSIPAVLRAVKILAQREDVRTVEPVFWAGKDAVNANSETNEIEGE